MKNAMRKTTLREIKGSFSRWIAILSICMLGFGFFSGLKVCKEAFILTGDTFLSDNCFYDYELISTLGLEEKDVAKFQDLEGISKARGSYSSDALFLISKDKDAADGKSGADDFGFADDAAQDAEETAAEIFSSETLPDVQEETVLG